MGNLAIMTNTSRRIHLRTAAGFSAVGIIRTECCELIKSWYFYNEKSMTDVFTMKMPVQYPGYKVRATWNALKNSISEQPHNES